MTTTSDNEKSKWLEQLPDLLVRLRSGKGLSRGQVARRLKITTTVLYNMETGRSRIKLDLFFQWLSMCGFDVRAVLRRHMFSVQELPSLDCADIATTYRLRLALSQKNIAVALGYRTGSIWHHFEKGLRIPDLTDFIGMMILAGDNVRGLIAELTGDKDFAGVFPGGTETTPVDWHEYWEHFFIPAVRHLMRTATYRRMKRYHPGFFADILGISYQQERYALKVLSSLHLINWVNAKPVIDEEQRIVIPRDIPREKIDGFKFQWLGFAREHYRTSPADRALMTLDLLPVSAGMFAEIRAKIRRLQDEIHNMQQSDTDGVAYIGWLSNYIAAG
jgi:hypothetical protein